MPALTVIVPATDRPPTLTRCLASIAAAAQAPEEVIVIEEPVSDGAAEARNRGAAQATSEILVFVDSDVLVHADAFVRIRAAFEAEPELAAVFGSYDVDSGRGRIVPTFRNLLLYEVHRQGAGAASTFWTGLGAVRRDAFMATGGFDGERYRRPSIEDIDFGLRLSARGERIELDPSILGTHLKPWTFAEMIRIDLFDRGIPWVRLMLRSREVPAIQNLRWSNRVSAALSLAVTAGVARGHKRLAALPLAALIAINRRFYALLAREHGWRTAIAGVALHIVHHLTSVAAVALGVLAHLGDRSR